jgi:hypothetical protein
MSSADTALNELGINQLNTIYFVDASLPDLTTLLASLPVGAEIHLIEAGADGLQLIADTLYGRSGIDAIHLLTHGSAGSLSLGSTTLTIDNLASYDAQWATIQSALSDQADLLIYGCDVAVGDAGATFVQALATATGADVAASTDITGSAVLGGNWVLEAQTGAIETQAVAAVDYSGILFSFGGYNFQTVFSGALTTSDPINAFRSGCYWDRYTLSNVANGTDVAIYMGDSALDDYLQIERNGSILIQDDDSGDGERSYDAFLHWSYQAGDVIRVTSYSTSIPTGSYNLYVSVNTTVTDIGSAPPPPANVAPTFSATTFNNGNAITDTAADDSYPQL